MNKQRTKVHGSFVPGTGILGLIGLLVVYSVRSYTAILIWYSKELFISFLQNAIGVVPVYMQLLKNGIKHSTQHI